MSRNHKDSDKNPNPANDKNGTAWLNRPEKLFTSTQPAAGKKNANDANGDEAVTENNSQGKHEADRATGKNKNHGTKQYLALIEKIVKTFQVENDTFAGLMKNILDATDSKDVKNKSMKYDLINDLLVNLSQSSVEEVSSIKDKVTAILIPLHMKHLYVDNSSIQIWSKLGEGSSGEVFLGFLTKNGKRKTVAVKKARHRIFEDMLKDEARAISQLDHENIVKLLAVNREESALVMEFMELGSFSDAVERFNFSKENVVKILKGVASGMEYLHSQGFLHRDLAIRNIFINAKKECKIGDFGTCVYVGNTNGIYADKVYSPNGVNISPESCMTKLFTVESDVWAMGILILDAFYIAFEDKSLDFLLRRSVIMNLLRSDMTRLERHRSCSETVFLYCTQHLLNARAKNRPKFTAIKRKLQEIWDQKSY